MWLDNLDFVHSHNQRGGSYWVRAGSLPLIKGALWGTLWLV